MPDFILGDGVRVQVRQPHKPRFTTAPPAGPRVALVAVRGVPGPQGPAGLSSGEADTAALTTHITDPTPHAAYDDAPDLTLLFENGLI